MKNCGIIFYTDNTIDDPIKSVVESRILQADLPIVSVSLKPMDFGFNIVYPGRRGYVSYINQITLALENSLNDYVFFCESDVLYPKSHFEFNPPRDDVYYYNSNIYRWWYRGELAITYDRLLCLSGLCCNRELALSHYKLIQQNILEHPGEFDGREPSLARKWGYEPGTKKKKRGGLTDEDFETWESKDPIIDIRHSGTYSPPKITLDSFKHPPKDWVEIPIDSLPYWNLRKEFLL